MEPFGPLQYFLLVGSLLFVAYLLRGFWKAFFQTTRGLGEIGQAFLVHIGNAEQVRKMFYSRPWTPAEAQSMLKELRHQLVTRTNPQLSPELAILGKENTQTLLMLAVFSKIILSTEEIRRRIAFLEEILRKCNGSRIPNQYVLSS